MNNEDYNVEKTMVNEFLNKTWYTIMCATPTSTWKTVSHALPNSPAIRDIFSATKEFVNEL